MDASTGIPTQPVPNSTPPVSQEPPVVAIAPNEPIQAMMPGAPSGHGTKLKKIIFFFIAILILALIGGGTVYAIAYDKLKINNPEIEKKIAQFVQGLPFAPKTPKFLLNAAMAAHEKATSFDFNISVAAKSNGLTSLLGTNQGDVSIQGFIDYKDPARINFSLNGGLSTDFNIDVRKKDQFYYLKLNKIPLTILALVGIKDQSLIQPVLENWVGIDITPPNTEARKALDAQKSQDVPINDKVNEELNKLMEKVFLNAIVVSSEDLDQEKTYKLVFTPNTAVWDFIDKQRDDEYKKQYPTLPVPITKTADMFEKFVVTIWLGQKDYLIRKTEIITDIKSDMPLSYLSPLTSVVSSSYGMVPDSKEKTVTSVVGVIKLSTYNQPKNVEVPAKYMSPEEFYAKVMNAISGKRVSANDTTRQADIEKIFQLLTTCYQITVPHIYPKTLEDLKTCNEIATVPVDPGSNQPYEYQTNAARSKFSLKAKLDLGGYYEANEGGIINNSNLGTTTTELMKRSRDAARLTDLANLQQVINVIMQESTASSNIVCQGMPGNPKTCIGSSIIDSGAVDGTGWIKVNLNQTKSISVGTLPADPINNVLYKYLYCGDGNNFQLITKLESDQQSLKMNTDGGSDPTLYEIGSMNGANLLNIIPGCIY